MKRPNGKRGFTLVELLVVIAIIGLLVGILVPVVGTAIKLMGFTRVQARVLELGAGCVAYYQDFNYYPGQRYANDPIGGSKGSGGPYTGSQILAADLFSYTYTNITNTAIGSPTSATKYAPFRSGDVDKSLIGATYQAVQYGPNSSFTANNGTAAGPYPFTLMDRNDDPLAMLYFPARLDGDPTQTAGTSTTGVFRYFDNADYIEDDVVYKNYKAAGGTATVGAGYRLDRQTVFANTFMVNASGSTTNSYRSFGCAIVAAGMKRTYLDSSDWAVFPR